MTPAKSNSVQMDSILPSARRQKGFTLIEALVAFMILSIGMLGIASLQLISVKAGHTAAVRMVAVTKVEDMFERIRNNPIEVLNYDNAATGPSNTACNDYGGSVNSCVSGDLVAYDKYEWEQELAASLPNITVTTNITVVPVVAAASPLSTVVITINWDERNPETQTTTSMTYSASADICGNTAC